MLHLPNPLVPDNGFVGVRALDSVLRPAAGSSRNLFISLASSGLAQGVFLAALAVAGGRWDSIHLDFLPPPHGHSSPPSTLTVEFLASNQPQETDLAGVQILASERLDTDEQKAEPVAKPVRLERNSWETVLIPLSSNSASDFLEPTAEGLVNEPDRQRTNLSDNDMPANDSRQEARPLVRQAVEIQIPPTSIAAQTSTTESKVAPESAVAAGTKQEIPQTIFSPSPEYPADALARRVSGRAVLRVELKDDGSVRDVSIWKTSGEKSLDDAALAAVKRWRFEVIGRAGRAAFKPFAVPIRFVIEDAQR